MKFPIVNGRLTWASVRAFPICAAVLTSELGWYGAAYALLRFAFDLAEPAVETDTRPTPWDRAPAIATLVVEVVAVIAASTGSGLARIAGLTLVFVSSGFRHAALASLRTGELMTQGPYRYMAHPASLGLAGCLVGLVLMSWSLAAVGVLAAWMPLRWLWLRREESENCQRFPEYRSYRSNLRWIRWSTKRAISTTESDRSGPESS